MKCKGYTGGSPCCTDCDRLRRDNARLRAWLRYLQHRAGVIGWGGVSSGEVLDEFNAALAGKPTPRNRLRREGCGSLHVRAPSP